MALVVADLSRGMVLTVAEGVTDLMLWAMAFAVGFVLLRNIERW